MFSFCTGKQINPKSVEPHVWHHRWRLMWRTGDELKLRSANSARPNSAPRVLRPAESLRFAGPSPQRRIRNLPTVCVARERTSPLSQVVSQPQSVLRRGNLAWGFRICRSSIGDPVRHLTVTKNNGNCPGTPVRIAMLRDWPHLRLDRDRFPPSETGENKTPLPPSSPDLRNESIGPLRNARCWQRHSDRCGA